jgi:hypothetical protein
MFRLVVVGLFVVSAGACSKKRNPDKCCVDEADCASIGLPNGSTCGEHELCRGNECIELTCTASSECDPTAPFCMDGSCASQCVSDDACPGFGQQGTSVCVDGDCVECREEKDCQNHAACVGNRCIACATDDECESGVCITGACGDASTVAFTNPAGSGTSDCTKTEPCTLLRALTIVPARPAIKLADGVYQNTGTIALSGTRTISGNGPDKTSVTNTGPGPIFTIDSGDHTLEGMKIFGATTATGVGVKCPTTTGAAKLRLLDAVVEQNASDGLVSEGCMLTVQQSRFVGNAGFGARVTGSSLSDFFTIERSSFIQNGGGIKATGGGTLRNVIAAGLELFSDDGFGHVKVEFSTITSGITCLAGSGLDRSSLSNVIVTGGIVDNQPPGNRCAFSTCFATGPSAQCTQYTSGDLLLDATYHLQPGSVAIDRASNNTAFDFDGDARPKGAASDVGADEAF